ncbi:hypothetical protein GCM10011348_22590 [Marinobacterium nitratireducens]|uniref:Hydantoin racemase n=1 Tax=Marinobacterium nitratireducens TaxID=518897 RepID=A0A917ZFE7_9GAMM|nr:aspartate/glutamate racemase family protein [Marinobacterium nitratireducens]GGO82071.1 hypothetical protein GCM10011348_22590 [Marinobacterium nitratireducens]
MSETDYLILNGNTDTRMTGRMVQLASAHFGDEFRVRGISAETGALSIRTPEQCVQACTAVRAMLSKAQGAVEIGILGTFGLPDFDGLRARSPFPLIDLVEGGVNAARQLTDRYAIVTVGGRWPSMLQLELKRRGLLSGCVGIQALPQLAFDPVAEPQRLAAWLREPVAQLIEDVDPGAVLLGGAVFAGLGEAVQDGVEVPVIDAFSATLELVETLQLMQQVGLESPLLSVAGARSGPACRSA